LAGIGDLRIFEDAGITPCRLFGLVVKPQARGDSLKGHGAYSLCKRFAETKDRLGIASIYSYDEWEGTQSTACAKFFSIFLAYGSQAHR
jgi:hypothetical protein